MTQQPYNASVIGKIQLTPDLMILRVKADKPNSDFKPGQYINLGMLASETRSSNSVMPIDNYDRDKLIKRPYYIASVDSKMMEFEFYISQVKSGQLTPRLFNLTHGRRLWIDDKIMGIFDLNSVPKEHDLLLVATGTGLSPYISFLRSHIKNNLEKRITIIHGAAYRWDLGYYSELSLLNNNFENFKYYPTLIKEDDSWEGLKGYVEDHFEKGIVEDTLKLKLDPEKTSIFLCGNSKMVEKVLSYLSTKGYDKDCKGNCPSLHVEQYNS